MSNYQDKAQNFVSQLDKEVRESPSSPALPVLISYPQLSKYPTLNNLEKQTSMCSVCGF